MRPDNWTTCPRCWAAYVERVEAETAAVMALYGTVSVEEFDAKRAALPTIDQDQCVTFREDYDIGLEGSEFAVNYRGSCTSCRLAHKVDTRETVWPA